jgi:hypothetical protein
VTSSLDGCALFSGQLNHDFNYRHDQARENACFFDVHAINATLGACITQSQELQFFVPYHGSLSAVGSEREPR